MIAMALATTIVCPAYSQVQQIAQSHDIQCFIVTSSLIGNKDQSINVIGLVSSSFFAGKIFGENPDIDLVVAIKAQAILMKPENNKNLLGECGAEMTTRGKQMSVAGQTIVDEAKEPPRSVN